MKWAFSTLAFYLVFHGALVTVGVERFWDRMAITTFAWAYGDLIRRGYL